MSYWSDRQKQLLKQMEKDEGKLKKRLSSFYDAEFRRLDKEIAAYYAKYGKGNVIEYRTMMESLSEDDRKLLMEKMDEFAEKYPQYKDLMPVRTSIYKLNRLEGLQYSILMHQLEIGAVNNTAVEKYLKDQTVKGLNAAAEVLGFGKNFYSVNDDIVKTIVGKQWANGKNFSERIWGNTKKLAEYLSTDISQGFARGDSYEKLIGMLRERYSKVNRNDAYRLIYTEGTFVHAESTMKPFEEDFERYRLSTVGDGKVCPICRGVAEQVFDIKDRQPGVNFPPLHAWCRCTFTVEVDDWDEWLDEYEKRHGNGKAHEVVLRIASPGSTKSYKRALKAIQENRAGLDKRRTNILNRIPNEGDYHRFEKDSISERNLAYLSAAAKVEFTLFRSKNEDILIRGNARTCDITGDIAEEILSKRYEWVAHTHVDRGPLKPSLADRNTLRLLEQEKSIIVDMEGNMIDFGVETN